MSRIIATIAAAALLAAPTFATAQTVKAVTGMPVPKLSGARIASTVRRMPKPAALPIPVLAGAAQKTLGLPAQPSIGGAVVLDAAHLQAGGAAIWFENVVYASDGASAPMVAMGLEGAKSRIAMTFAASGKAAMVDCDFQLAAAGDPPLTSSFTLMKAGDGVATALFAGTAQVGQGHIVVAVPPAPVPAGTILHLQINAPGLSQQSDFMVFNACRLYQLG